MLRVAVRDPMAEGVKDTTMVQFAPAASELPQVSFWVKSLGSAPVKEKPEMLTVLPPVLVRVTVWGELVVLMGSLEKLRLAGESVTLGEVLAPVPVRLTDWALTLLAIETDAVRVPPAEGVKVTLMVQFPLGATLEPQVLVWAKSLAFAPTIVMLETVNAAFPELLRVTDFAELVALNVWLPKLRLEGETLIPAAAPVPERLTV